METNLAAYWSRARLYTRAQPAYSGQNNTPLSQIATEKLRKVTKTPLLLAYLQCRDANVHESRRLQSVGSQRVVAVHDGVHEEVHRHEHEPACDVTSEREIVRVLVAAFSGATKVRAASSRRFK